MSVSRLLDKTYYYKNNAEFLIPFIEGNKLLSIGCGDGTAESLIMEKTNCKVTGLEVTEYNETKIPTMLFDGTNVPFIKREFDYTMFVYSLHHTGNKNDIRKLLLEAKRVSKKGILILDHAYENVFDRAIISAWDYFSNKLKNHKMKITFNFLKEKEWLDLFKKLNLKVEMKAYPFSSIFFRLLV